MHLILIVGLGLAQPGWQGAHVKAVELAIERDQHDQVCHRRRPDYGGLGLHWPLVLSCRFTVENRTPSTWNAFATEERASSERRGGMALRWPSAERRGGEGAKPKWAQRGAAPAGVSLRRT